MSRLGVMLSDTHRGAKKQPDWLDVSKLPGGPNAPNTSRAADLPRYVHGNRDGNRGIVIQPAAIRLKLPQSGDDVEDYLRSNRWAFLTLALLNEPVDWHGVLGECAVWIGDHVDRRDEAWDPYSTSERISNLVIFLACMPAQTRERNAPPGWREFVAESLVWLSGHIEYYGPHKTNNHILNNARALVLGGVTLGWKPAIDAGIRTFRRWLPELVLEGGFLRERSSHYQLIVFNWILDAWRFASHRDGDAGDDAVFLWNFVERMREASSLLCAGGETLRAVIGDVCPDLTPAQSLARLAMLYPEIWPGERASDPESRSPLIIDGWFRIAAFGSVVLGNFPAGQYPPSYPSHGHCDLTSFSWTHGSREILADPGRNRYTADAVSIFQQSAAAHNLPLVDGLAPLSESVIRTGLWWPLPYASAVLDMRSEANAAIILAHDGFFRATAVRSHRRTISVEPSGLAVVDAFEGSGEVDVGLCWQFAEGFDRFDAMGMAAVGVGGTVQLKLDGFAGQPTICGCCDGKAVGLISSVYGGTRPAVRIVVRARVRLPASLTTRFSVVR